MSLRLSAAAVRTYDALKRRPRAVPRRSDARDAGAIEAIDRRLRELILAYRIGEHRNETGVYVFWSEIEARIGEGAFDDLLDRL